MSAWAKIYKVGLSAEVGSPVGYGIVAIKKELIFNGFGTGIDVGYKDKNGNYFFGSGTATRAKEFQKSVGITADGEVGPTTARHLFAKRAAQEGFAKGVADNLLSKLKTLESANDPAAVGFVDPLDMGLMQIHMPFHPDVSQAEAFDPAFSLSWGANYLKSANASFKDWDAAVASYNVGSYYAGQWLKDGKPTSGGVILSNGQDIYQRASQYVKLVKAQQV
jgi:hypothetical protein